MTAVAAKRPDVYAFARQFDAMGKPAVTKLLGIADTTYDRLGSQGVAQYYQSQLDAKQFGLDCVA